MTLEKFLLVTSCTVVAAAGIFGAAQVDGAAPAPSPASIEVVPGMPPVVDPSDIYSETGPNHLSPAVRGDLERIYVPDLRSDDVSVIDPMTMKVVDRIKAGHGPQHVVPSYDLRTLWVTNNAERRTDGSLTPIDPRTGKPGKSIPVDDPYNMYFTPDGRSAIVVAEALRRLDFRDPHTMALQYSIGTPGCGGVNHADFSIDGRYAIFTCEFDGSLAKIDLPNRKVLGYLKLNMPRTRFKDTPLASDPEATEICTATKGMPQDIRISPDGRRFYVADMEADGVHIRFDAAREAAGKENAELAAWQFRDLRAKTASDSESLDAAQSRLGHTSSSTTRRVYRRGEKVRPLR